MDRYSHVLAAVDFSDSSKTVLRRALQESRLHAAELTFLHVIEYYPDEIPPGLVPPENTNPIDVYRNRALEHLARLAGELGAESARHTALTNTGAAYHEIVRFAQDSGVDLIVMGYAGRWVVDALGSTAMAVTRHVVCDVLLVRHDGVRP